MKKSFIYFILLLFVFSCNTAKKLAKVEPVEDGKIEVVFIQINDVYEIAPLPGSGEGGMARVAKLKKDLLEKNPNTFLVHAGDFLNPSLIGTLKHEGERIRGKQMVEVMNASGVDIVTFGNHEFDIAVEDLQRRINESDFDWISANVLQKTGDEAKPFAREKEGSREEFPATQILDLTDKDGTKVKIGLFGVTLPFNTQPYLKYEDVNFKSIEAYGELKQLTDFVLGLTHLNVDDDLYLAEILPGIPLIMGGHDHDNMLHKVGESVVAKADANAKTVYVHTLSFDQSSGTVDLSSELVKMDESRASDPAVEAIVNKWVDIENASFASAGFNKTESIYFAATPLDALESSIRTKQTNFGTLVAGSMFAAGKHYPDCALLNGGSVRLDDKLSGNITQYDILRALPFGGGLVEVEMKPRLLKKILETGDGNKGAGGYLQRWNADYRLEGKLWIINGEPLNFDRNYSVVLTDFLLLGLESNFEFLNADNPDIIAIHRPNPDDESDLRNDIRLAMIDYLRKL